jgi:glycosyltransferase involved in cell wall biosynthesis
MNGTGTVCAVVPAYNSEDTVGDVVRGVLRHLPVAIVADDGSSDGTSRAAAAAGAEVIRVPENRGKGNSLRLLFAEAKRRGFSAVVAIDSDGQHDPEDIPRFLAAHREDPEAVILGSRMGDPAAIPPHRFNSMLVARFYICLAANRFVDDTQCGYRLYPLSLAGSIAMLKERFVAETEILIKAGDSGTPVRSLPIVPLYKPRQKTHFRSVPDVAAISVYVISYLMVKWAIETFRPGVKYTYRGAGTGRDRIFLGPRTDRAFEALMVLLCMPLSAMYGALYFILRAALGIRSFEGLQGCGVPVGKVFASTLLLPVLMAVSITDLVCGRLGFRPNLSGGFVRRFYPNLW